MTTAFNDKNAEIERFVSQPRDEDFKRDLLSRYNVRYLLMAPHLERPGGFQPQTARWLKPVFAQGRVALYKVIGRPAAM